MEEETQENIKVAQSNEAQSQKREEESSLDGEFIKVEKETLATKGDSHLESEVRSVTDPSSRVLELEIGLDKALKSTKVELSAKDSLIDEMYRELELIRSSERQLKGKCAELETKLKLSEVEFGKADAFSAQVILKNAELEHELKSLEETRLRLQDREAQLEAVQVKNKELKQDIEKLTGLHLKLKELETDNEQMKYHHQDKVSELESTLSQSSFVKSELEEEIKNLMAKLQEAENLLQVMRGELNVKQGKLEEVGMHMVALAEANMKLNEELAMSESKLNGAVQKQHLSETNVAAQNQLLQLEKQLKECKESKEAYKAELENLRLEAVQNLTLQARVKEQLLVTEAGFRMELEKELASAQDTISVLREEKCKLESAQESVVKQTCEELEAKTQQVILLEKHVKELEQKLHTESVISKEKGDEAEVRSRDIGSILSSPMKSGSSFTQTSSALTEIQHKIMPSLHNLKLVLGVALVSIIIGLILGKTY